MAEARQREAEPPREFVEMMDVLESSAW